MSRILGLIVTPSQGQEVTAALVTFGPVTTPPSDSDVLTGFAQRLNDVCDDMGITPDRGRQTALAKQFGVNPKAARKWLLGIGLPELATAIRIAVWGDVNLTWLLQGSGAKRGMRVDTKALVLDEAVRSLPSELGTDLVDNLRAKLQRIGRLSAEPASRYRSMLDGYEKEFCKKRPH